MRREPLVLASLLAACVTLSAPARPTAVGLVDLQHVMTVAKPFAAGDEEIRKWIDARREEIRAARDGLEGKRAGLEAFTRSSAERAKLELEIAKESLELEFAVSQADRDRERRILEHQRKAFEAASEAIAAVARERGLDVVLQLRSGELRATTQAELSSEIYLRHVMSFDAGLDITSDVISILNR
jgi:Skp family chaperone for outer membrane proteins